MGLITMFGFSVGDRVMSGSAIGTVVDPGYEPSEEMLDRRCVPVVWDRDKSTRVISWTFSTNLVKIDTSSR